MKEKAIIAMSGGVDSSVAALLCSQMNYECIGATMKLFDNEDTCIPKEQTCCSLEDVEDAKSIAQLLGMKHYVFNFKDDFREKVINKFVCSYESGSTPNPCIECNRHLKFEKLFQRAKELGYDYVATGHYARIEYDNKKGQYLLKKASDQTKDQSYVLYSMTKEQLAHTLFPLGKLSKAEVRAIAEQHGFINAKKHDSQDICFVKDGDYVGFIEKYTGKTYPEGNFIDKEGNILGKHKGIIRYTVGQRRGLGISAENPLYVSAINPAYNTVTLVSDNDLYTKSLIAKDINLISVESIEQPMRVTAKVRYRHKEKPATVTKIDSDTIKVEFDEPQRAITKGQSVVLYDGDIVVGGGIIQ